MFFELKRSLRCEHGSDSAEMGMHDNLGWGTNVSGDEAVLMGSIIGFKVIDKRKNPFK